MSDGLPRRRTPRDRAELLRGQHRAARAAGARARRDRPRARAAAVRDRDARARQRLRRRVRAGGGRPRRRGRGDRALRAPRQGDQRHGAAAARPRALRAAAQRGLGAARGRDPRPARRPRRRAAGRVRGGPAPAPRRLPAGVRVAVPRTGGRPRGRPAAPAAVRRAEPRAAHAQGRLVPVLGAARAHRRGRRGGLPRPRLLRLLRRGRLRPAAARRGLEQPVRARPRALSTTSSSRRAPRPSGASSSWRATAISTCESTTRPQPRASCAG